MWPQVLHALSIWSDIKTEFRHYSELRLFFNHLTQSFPTYLIMKNIHILTLWFGVFVFPIEEIYSGSIEITEITPSQFCDGAPTGSIDLSVEGAYAPITYFWYGGPNGEFSAETQDISGLYPGEYCVTVTDGLCGTASLCVEVGCTNQCPEITLEGLDNAIEHPTTCESNDGSIYFRFGGPAGGLGPYVMTLYDNERNIIPRETYGWNNLAAGLYTISVVDANGCTGDFEVELIPQSGVVIADYFIEPPCPGESNGTIEILVVGSTEYTISWSNGATTPEIKELAAGTYCVTITDEICNVEECFTLNELDLAPLEITSARVIDACAGFSSGEIDIINVDGGKPPYTYEWNDDYGTSSDLTAIPPGQYCVTITDACNATLTQCYTVSEVPALSVTGTVVADACLTIDEDDIFSVPKGEIDIEVSGGNGGYEIQWSHDENYTGTQPRGLDPGIYCVTVTGTLGACGTASECFLVEERDALVVTIADYQQCDNGDCSNAFIDIDVSGNTGPVTYDWFGYVEGGTYFESDAEDIDPVPGIGSYCVTATSADECPAELCIDIEDCADVPEPSIIQHFIAPQSEVFEYGAIDINVQPQDYDFAYSWIGPDGFTASTQDLFPAAGAGVYTVTVNNGCGVEVIETYTIEECQLELSVASIDNRCSGEGYATVLIDVANTDQDDRFLFLDPETETFQPTSSRFFSDGNYTRLVFSTGDGNANIAIINEDGCGGIVSVTIEPSTIHANSWNYSYFFPNLNSSGGYVPVYCGIATTCAGALVDDEFVDAYEVSTPSLEYDPNTDATCIMNLSCGSHFNFTIEGNVIADIVTLAPDGVSCLQGEFCRGNIILSNNQTGFRDYHRLLTGTDNPDHQSILVTVDAPFQAVNIGAVQTTTKLVGKDCIRERECPDGTIVEQVNIGDPVTHRDCRTNATTGAQECWDVETCGDQIVNETYLGDLPPYSCGCIIALVSNNGSGSELTTGTINNRIINQGSTTSIRPVDISSSIGSYRLKQDIEASVLDYDKGHFAFVYPNPTTNILNIRFDNEQKSSTYKITLTDILGQKVLSTETYESTTVNLRELEAGVYILTIFDADGKSQSQQIFKH